MLDDMERIVERSWGNVLLWLLVTRLDKGGLLPPDAPFPETFNGKAARMKTLRPMKRRVGPESAVSAPAPLTPLDYALDTLRDEQKPDSLRASMAKAAMPYVHGPGAAAKAANPEVPVEEGWPTLELAGHIAHILGIAYDQMRAKELAAQGWDVKTQRMPFDPDEWPRFQVAIVQILEYCKAQANLDRQGISD